MRCSSIIGFAVARDPKADLSVDAARALRLRQEQVFHRHAADLLAPEIDAELLRLIDVLGWRPSHVAEVVGTSKQDVSRRLRRARSTRSSEPE